MATVAASLLFMGAMLHAAIIDFRQHRVLNKTIIALAIAYLPLAHFAGIGWIDIISAIVAASLIFVIGFAGFCAGWIGGGDVKLTGIATLWIGAGLVVPFLALAGFFAVLLRWLIRRFRAVQADAPTPDDGLPFGPGIVLAAMALFPLSQWFTGG